MMKQLLVATKQQPLLQGLKGLAGLYGVQIVCPRDFADMAFSDATAMVIDPDCLSADCWQTYLDYLLELTGEDSTPLVVLISCEQPESSILPARIMSKPTGSLFRCYDDDVPAVLAIVEEALLGTKNQWNLSGKECCMPSILEEDDLKLI